MADLLSLNAELSEQASVADLEMQLRDQAAANARLLVHMLLAQCHDVILGQDGSILWLEAKNLSLELTVQSRTARCATLHRPVCRLSSHNTGDGTHIWFSLPKVYLPSHIWLSLPSSWSQGFGLGD